MHKYKVKNTSKAAVFLTEAGRLLRPGEEISVARIDKGTREDKRLQITTGEFTPPAPVIKAPKKVVEDDEETNAVTKATVQDSSPAELVDRKRASKSVPLVAAGGENDAGEHEGEHEKVAAATDGHHDDELESLIPKAEKPADKEEPAGFHVQKGLTADDEKKTDGDGGLGR